MAPDSAPGTDFAAALASAAEASLSAASKSCPAVSVVEEGFLRVLFAELNRGSRVPADSQVLPSFEISFDSLN